MAALLALLSPVSFASAQTPIYAELDAPFLHEGSGITVPAQIGSFSRASVTDLADQQLNVAIQFRERGDATSLTLFIYRAAAPNVSIWGDFSSIRMLNNPAIGNAVDGSFFLGRFTPPNGSGAGSALHARALVEGQGARSTALSIFAHNDWIVKLRATSSALSDDELTAVMARVLSELPMSQSETTYPPVTFIQPCEKPIKFEENLVTRRLDLFDAMSMALAVNEVSVTENLTDRGEEPWCRDTQSTSQYGLYREANSKRDYFMALSDAGLGAYVSRFRTTLIKTRFSGYLVKVSDGITEDAWHLFDKRPHPAFVYSRIGSFSPIATLDVRPGAEGRSTIVLPTAK